MDSATKLTLQSVVRLLDDVAGEPAQASWRARVGQIRPEDRSALRVFLMSLELKTADTQAAHEAVSEGLIGTNAVPSAVPAGGFAILKKPSLHHSEKRFIESALVTYSQQMGQFPSEKAQLKDALQRGELAGCTSATSIIDSWLSSMRHLSTDLKKVLGRTG